MNTATLLTALSLVCGCIYTEATESGQVAAVVPRRAPPPAVCPSDDVLVQCKTSATEPLDLGWRDPKASIPLAHEPPIHTYYLDVTCPTNTKLREDYTNFRGPKTIHPPVYRGCEDATGRASGPSLRFPAPALNITRYGVGFATGHNTLALGSYKNGRRHGAWRFYFNSGRSRPTITVLYAAATYKDGVLHGTFTEWDRTAKVRAVGHFNHGQPTGIWHRYDFRESVPKIGLRFVAGGPDEKYELKSWALLRHQYFPDGKVLRHEWRDDRDNFILTSEQRLDHDGKLDGQETSWYDNGFYRRRTYYRTGIRHGNDMTWYENGRPKTQGAYVDDKRNGVWKYWSDDGRLERAGEFKDNKKTGLWVYWDTSGIVKRKEYL